jgi:organic hydroperoxide reductase OsmC/OhrA
MPRTHHYETTTTWTGNTGEGTAAYRSYERSHQTAAEGRPAIVGSSDPAFRGDAERWNPELLLVAALSQCHLLAYLHQCTLGCVVVTAYVDPATGTMAETPDGGGHFEDVVLRPVVTVADAAMTERARELHEAAAERCFIANSVNFPVRHAPEIVVAQEGPRGG